MLEEEEAVLTSSSSKSGLVKNFGKKYSSSACSDESIFSSSPPSSSSSSFTVRPLPPSDLAGPAETALLAFVAAADSVDEPLRSFAFFVAARNASRVARTPSRNEEKGVVEVEVEVEAAGGWKSKGGLMK